MKKINTGKVGRPKLADKRLKKESMIVCVFVLVSISIFAFIGFDILKITFSPNYLVGKIYNDHVSSCVIKKNKIDCGPNVSYMKYSFDNKKYEEYSKVDSSIKVDVSNPKNIKVCYKTFSNNKLKCTR